MDELHDAPTRPLDAFEREALAGLRGGESVDDVHEFAGADAHARVHPGRAAVPALLHGVQRRGELLGAFSYQLSPGAGHRPVKTLPARRAAWGPRLTLPATPTTPPDGGPAWAAASRQPDKGSVPVKGQFRSLRRTSASSPTCGFTVSLSCLIMACVAVNAASAVPRQQIAEVVGVVHDVSIQTPFVSEPLPPPRWTDAYTGCSTAARSAPPCGVPRRSSWLCLRLQHLVAQLMEARLADAQTTARLLHSAGAGQRFEHRHPKARTMPRARRDPESPPTARPQHLAQPSDHHRSTPPSLSHRPDNVAHDRR